METKNTSNIKNQKAIYIVRFIHALVATFFICCIAILYVVALSEKSYPWVAWIVVVMLLEGLILAINRGNCPLSFFHRKYGDNEKFYNLFLPEKIAPYATHVLGVLTVIGIILLIIRQRI